MSHDEDKTGSATKKVIDDEVKKLLKVQDHLHDYIIVQDEIFAGGWVGGWGGTLTVAVIHFVAPKMAEKTHSHVGNATD